MSLRKPLAAALSAVLGLSAVAPAWADAVPAGGKLSTGYGYDANGNLTQVNLPKGTGITQVRSQTHRYDSLQRRNQTTLAAPTATASAPVVGMTYDGQDQTTQVTDPRGLKTSYGPDGLGRSLSQTSPDTGTKNATYDAAGRLRTLTDARGKTTTFSYDDLGRLVSASYASGTASTYTYDGGTPATPNNSTGQLSSFSDESGSTAYTHDGLGRVLTKVQTTTVKGTRSLTLQQSWDSAKTGLLATLTTPGRNRLDYSYDAGGRVSAIVLHPSKSDGSAPDTSVSVPLLQDIQYTGLDLVKSWAWGSGVAYERGFDTDGRLNAYPLGNPLGSGNAAGLRRTLGFDDAGRLRSYTHQNGLGVAQPAYDQSFAYDGLDRLTSNTQSATSYDYGYDLSNNRTFRKLAGVRYNTTIAPTSNRQTAEADPAGAISYTHDAAGNVTGDGTNQFIYSDRGRLAGVRTVGLTTSDRVSYFYNALDQRVAKTGPTTRVDGGARYYAYDEAGHLIGEYDAAGNPAYEVVYLGDTPVAVLTQTRSGGVQTQVAYVYADHLDTARVIVRSSDHAIVWRWDQAEPFGNSVPNDNPSALGTFSFNHRFPGQIYDKESGLAYNMFRDYRARSGRYVQSDPIGLQGGINTYTYVEGDPTGNIDPMGLANGGAAQMWMRYPSKRPPKRPDGEPWGAGCGDKDSDQNIPDFFPKACAAHDRCYEQQCGKGYCDNKFLMDMYRERPNMPAIPWLYYRAVDLFGDDAYRNAGKPSGKP